jgi:hypothetical protein
MLMSFLIKLQANQDQQFPAQKFESTVSHQGFKNVMNGGGSSDSAYLRPQLNRAIRTLSALGS